MPYALPPSHFLRFLQDERGEPVECEFGEVEGGSISQFASSESFKRIAQVQEQRSEADRLRVALTCGALAGCTIGACILF